MKKIRKYHTTLQENIQKEVHDTVATIRTITEHFQDVTLQDMNDKYSNNSNLLLDDITTEEITKVLKKKKKHRIWPRRKSILSFTKKSSNTASHFKTAIQFIVQTRIHLAILGDRPYHIHS